MTFIREATKKTLFIAFENQEIKVEGNSITENPHPFFEEINAFLDEFESQGKEFDYHTLTIKITYINTSSLKLFMQLVRKIHVINPSIKIIWEHDEDDEDMMEIGEMFAAMLDLDIHLQTY